MGFCPNCGNNLPEGTKFCPECGCNIAQMTVEGANQDQQSIYNQSDVNSDEYNQNSYSQNAYNQNSYNQNNQNIRANNANAPKKKNGCLTVALIVIGAGVVLTIFVAIIASLFSSSSDSNTSSDSSVSTSKNSSKELYDLRTATEDEICDFFGVSKNEMGMYPSEDVILAYCLDGKILTIQLSVNDTSYSLCGIKIGDSKEAAEEKIKDGFTETTSYVISDATRYLYDDNNNMGYFLMVDIDGAGKVVNAGYGPNNETLGIDESSNTEESSEEDQKTEEKNVTTEKQATTEAKKEENFNPNDYRTDISFESLSRKPDDYIGKKIAVSGNVIEVFDSGDEKGLRIEVDGDFEKIMRVFYDPNLLNIRILEEDQVTVYGVYGGIDKYTAVLGNTIEIPYVDADKINVDSYDSTSESPTGNLRSGTYSVTRTENEFIYKKTANFSYQDGEAFGCTIRVVREIADRGKATILGDIFCFLKDEGNGVYTGKVDGKGSIKITAYESSIKVETFPDSGMESAFEQIADEYTFGDSTSGGGTYSDADFIFPRSDSAMLTESDIAGMDSDTLALGRNEIYARHGYIFQDPMFVNYFNSKSWYKPQYTGDQFDDSVFNDYERANIQFILSHE